MTLIDMITTLDSPVSGVSNSQEDDTTVALVVMVQGTSCGRLLQRDVFSVYSTDAVWQLP